MFTRYLLIASFAAFVAGVVIPPGIRSALASDDAAIAVDASATPVDAGAETAPGFTAHGDPGGYEAAITCPPSMAVVVGSGGIVSCNTPAVPASALHDPIANPLAAWQDELGARKDGWPVAVWCALVLLAKALTSTSKNPTWRAAPVIGAAVTWLAAGKRAMAIAAIGAVAAAVYNTLALGGAWGAALVAGGMAIAGLTHPTTQPGKSAGVDVTV